MHPVPEYPLGGWGSGPSTPAAAANAKKKSAPPAQKGSFKLTAIAASAEAVPGDQVNLHKLERFARVTASSWEEQNPAAGCLDPRNDSGWSPDLKTEGPVHLTATLARPLDPKATPHLTVQLNFGAGRAMIAGSIEFAVITGFDDGTDLPASVLAVLAKPAATRSSDEVALLWQECAAHSSELERTRVDLANARERLAMLTEPQSTMVMAIAEKPRDTFILNRGDYAQPREKVGPGLLVCCRACRRMRPKAGWVSRSGSSSARIRCRPAWR
jgi:hypothetical protein